MSRRNGSSFFEVLGRRAGWTLLCLAGGWLLAWTGAEALIVRADLQHADALVVLAGSSTYRERTQRAAQLFKEGKSSRILLTNDNLKSGWSEALQRNPLFVERAREELTTRGVPAENIEVVPGSVTSTYDEANRVRQYAAERGLHSILVVTSGYQSRRARWAFSKVFQGSGITTGIEPVMPGQEAPSSRTWWTRRLGWELVPGEYLKMIYYRIHYR